MLPPGRSASLAGYSGLFWGELKRTCRAFIANMRRASLTAICAPSKIAALNLSSELCDKSPDGARCLSGAGLGGGDAARAAFQFAHSEVISALSYPASASGLRTFSGLQWRLRRPV